MVIEIISPNGNGSHKFVSPIGKPIYLTIHLDRELLKCCIQVK